MNNTYGFGYPNFMNREINNNKIIINSKKKFNNPNVNNIIIEKPKTKNNPINESAINENQKLIEELLNEVDKYRSENEQMKNKIKQLENDNNMLNNEVNKAKKIIAGLNQKQNEEQETQYIILSLKETIKDQEKKINDLKTQINNTVNIKKSVTGFDFDDIIVVHFISMDQKINCALKCLKTDTFAEVEEKLYQKYDEFRETNNNFIAKGKTLLRFKKICDNGIKDGDTIQLIKIE